MRRRVDRRTAWLRAKGLAGVFAAFGLTSTGYDGAQCWICVVLSFSCAERQTAVGAAIDGFAIGVAARGCRCHAFGS